LDDKYDHLKKALKIARRWNILGMEKVIIKLPDEWRVWHSRNSRILKPDFARELKELITPDNMYNQEVSVDYFK